MSWNGGVRRSLSAGRALLDRPRGLLFLLYPCVPCSTEDGDEDTERVRVGDGEVEDGDRAQDRQDLLYVGYDGLV